jgi:hypothetical protein
MINIDHTGKKMDSNGKNRVTTGKKHLAFLPESANHSAVTGKTCG